jgi:integrase
MAQFAKTNSENLVKHIGSGVYYVAAKVGGKKIRKSLETSNLRAAKMKRDDLLTSLRAGMVSSGSKTLGDALALTLRRYESDASTKESTRDYYRAACAGLKKVLPVTLRAWSGDEQREWWKKTIKGRSAAWVNNAHAIVKMVVQNARAERMPVDECPLKRVPKKRKRESVLPSSSDFLRIVENIRSMRKSHSENMAQMVEFLAWSGLRIGELRAVTWEDVGDEWLTVRGGIEGTKNRKVRRLPISGPLRVVIEKRRYPGASGKVFDLFSCRESLRNACARLEIEHVRVHDLRHLFATRCIEKGVDIPTIAKWLGHSDGGALAMKTYGHLRDDHSLQSASLLG